MADAQPQVIAVKRIGRTLILTLDRPTHRNALDSATMRGLQVWLEKAERDQDVACVLLAGAPPGFCAGSDLKELALLDPGGMAGHEAETAAVVRRIAWLSKPVIAAVEGFALGGGFILAVSCDVVVTGRDARWRLPEVANGWLPPWGLGALLARVGPARARLLVWGAEQIDGAEAHRLGVADLLAEPGQAETRALAVADALAALPSSAVASTKRFFEPFAAADGERLDVAASRAFVQDCTSPAAQATFARFGARL